MWEFVVKTYEKYAGDGWHMTLMLAALVVLLLTVRKNKENLIFVLGSILVGVIYGLPATSRLIVSTFIGRSVYWRMFWLFPTVLVLALAGAILIGKVNIRFLREATLIGVILLIMISGKPVFFQEQFQSGENMYKLPEPTIKVCDMILEDAARQGIQDIYLCAPNSLLCYIRQYDASIRMPYGRNGFRHENVDQNQQGLISQMSSDDGTPETMNMLLREEECNYFIWHRDDGTEDDFVEHYDFVLLGKEKGYSVYRIDYE